MKTLLLTTAAALTLTLAAPSAFADHDRHDHDGQDAVAFGYGNGYSRGFNNYNYPVNNRFVPGYTPLNSGWSVGAFNPGWNSGWNSGYGQSQGCNRQIRPTIGYGGLQSPSILPGGCYRGGGQVYCPQNQPDRFFNSPSPYGYNSPYGFNSPLR